MEKRSPCWNGGFAATRRGLHHNRKAISIKVLLPETLSMEILMTGAELALARKNRGLTEAELGKAIGYRDPARAVRRLEASSAVNSRALTMIKVIFGTVDKDNVRERGARPRMAHPDQLSFAF